MNLILVLVSFLISEKKASKHQAKPIAVKTPAVRKGEADIDDLLNDLDLDSP